MGRRNRPFYRVVVIDSRKQRDGVAIEEVGWYDPIRKEGNYSLKKDRIIDWLQKGAQPSFAVRRLMKKSGILLNWHLIRQGLSEKEISHELQKWKLDQQERKKRKVEKEKERAKVAVKAKEKAEEVAKEEAEEKIVEPEEKTDKDVKSETEEETEEVASAETPVVDGPSEEIPEKEPAST